jgi:hypothetical protein
MANRALLIGINNYPDPRNTLQGCIKDSLAVKQLLQGYYGFNDDDIRVLHDEQATLANARSGLDWLVAGAAAGDRSVFYESSHGYHFVRDGTWVEVLCLYDEFLEDNELSRRTQVLPPGTLTVILDSCFSGGMDKLFFPDGKVQVARVKYFQPPPERALQDAEALQTFTQFKSFGHPPTGEPGVAAKAFTPIVGVPLAKAGSDLELNGLLFSACQSNETAADGSPATNGNSAFTFSLIKSHQVGIRNTELRDQAEQQLRNLHITQTPQLEGSPQSPDLPLRSFITMQALTRKDNQPMTPTAPGDVNIALSTIADQIVAQIQAASGQKSFSDSPVDGQYWGDVFNFASLLTPSLAQATAGKKAFQAKALTTETFALADPSHLQAKSWWNDVLAVVQEFTPVMANALSGGKGFQSPAGLTGVQPEHINNKAWWDDVLNTVMTTVPVFVNALQGSKDFKVGGAASDAPAITISSEHANDKSWWSDALSAVAQIAPYVVAAVA